MNPTRNRRYWVRAVGTTKNSLTMLNRLTAHSDLRFTICALARMVVRATQEGDNLKLYIKRRNTLFYIGLKGPQRFVHCMSK